MITIPARHKPPAYRRSSLLDGRAVIALVSPRGRPRPPPAAARPPNRALAFAVVLRAALEIAVVLRAALETAVVLRDAL
jgi:hypothetical protein